MISRRKFLEIGGLTAAVPLFRSQAPARPPIVDALGEVHLDYDDALLDQMRDSGLCGCLITLGNPAVHGPEAFDDVLVELSQYETHIRNKSERLMKATRAGDFEASRRERKLALMYGFQNATPFAADLKRLELFYGLGVRVVQLTYNTRNLLGDGCLERTNSGLSNFGIEVVKKMNDLGMLVDLSHCGPQTTLDGISESTKPAAFTHTACKAMFDHPRNKTDEALRKLADKGGAVGIYQINPNLGPKERNTLDDYLAHLDHAVKVAGIDHVGIGSDREHRIIPDTPEERRKLEIELGLLRPDRQPVPVRWPYFVSELNHPRRMERIADGLRRRGYAAEQIDKILGGNLMRLIRETVG